MTNLRKEVCAQIREARRVAGLSQSEVAREVGCNQSALSMFEQGQTTKVSDEVVEKLAKKFGIELKARVGGATPALGVRLPPLAEDRPRGFCPNPHCPSNRAYQVEEKTFYLPDRKACDPVGGKFCAMCGEVLERQCPNCGAPVHDGAVCSLCGQRYVAT